MSRLPEGRRSAIATATPLITMGLSWGVRKGMVAVYEARTGRPAPVVGRGTSVMSQVLWAASVAAAIALVEALVLKALADDE